MQNMYIDSIAKDLNVNSKRIVTIHRLFEQQATIPFIARYRKETTGNLDEEQIREIAALTAYYAELDKRKTYILKVINNLGKLTPDLVQQIKNELDAEKLEDLFLPYKPAKKTRASKARNAGLEPLAKEIMRQKNTHFTQEFKKYCCDDFPSADDVKQGVIDIIAEIIATDAAARNKIRNIYRNQGSLKSKYKQGSTKNDKYKNYDHYSESLKKVKNHRILAVFRGVREDELSAGIAVDEQIITDYLKKRFLNGYGQAQKIIIEAIDDGYKRLLHPSMEHETLRKLKENADREAVKLFADNLRQLLLAPPLGEKRIMAIDPGYKSGCKVVCLDEQGNLLHNETIYPHPPQKDTKKAMKKIQSLSDAYQPAAIAIGNGTASKATEQFIRRIKFTRDIEVYMVNEDGASVYSASKIAREEFPEYDVTVRGSVSIGRRLSDPLAELIKIDPKSIGVGQYQHDVDQKMLKTELDKTVYSCVNEAGVNLNTASHHLLSYISGLTPALAKNIVAYRKENGKFKTRNALLKVPRLGPKAFEQCAGFLRIRNGSEPLDNTGVHPESYAIAERICKLKSIEKSELINTAITLSQQEKEALIKENAGEYTLNDIIKEINQPGRDPRGESKVFTFNQSLQSIEDLKEGMRVPAIVTNITDFGAFVDIGIKQNGLIHISEIADEYIAHPSEKLHINQQLILKVIHFDIARGRIQLSLKNNQ